MYRLIPYLKLILIFILPLFFTCAEDDSLNPKNENICFTTDGYYVTVYNMWSDGSLHSVDLEGKNSFSEDIDRDNEYHSLDWMNIVANNNLNTISSFDVVIDGIEYNFPENKCEGSDPEPGIYLIHNTGKLKVTLFNNGAIGNRIDYTRNPIGVSYNGRPDALFSGGLIFGAASRKNVNGYIGSFSLINDFRNVESLSDFSADMPNWTHTTKAIFEDASAIAPYGLTIIQYSYFYSGENFIFIRYNFSNNPTAYGKFYAGIFADWDVGGIGYTSTNLGGYDLERNMAYQYSVDETADSNYYGIIALNGLAGANITYTGETNDIRDSSFVWISNLYNEPINVPADYRMWVGSGPFLLNLEPIDVFFVITAGENLDILKNNADSAIQKYNDVFAK